MKKELNGKGLSFLQTFPSEFEWSINYILWLLNKQHLYDVI